MTGTPWRIRLSWQDLARVPVKLVRIRLRNRRNQSEFNRSWPELSHLHGGGGGSKLGPTRRTVHLPEARRNASVETQLHMTWARLRKRPRPVGGDPGRPKRERGTTARGPTRGKLRPRSSAACACASWDSLLNAALPSNDVPHNSITIAIIMLSMCFCCFLSVAVAASVLTVIVCYDACCCCFVV